MKDMQYPDILSVHSGSRGILWSGGSKILPVGNCFSATELLLRRKECSASVWHGMGRVLLAGRLMAYPICNCPVF